MGVVGSWLNDLCAWGDGARPYLLYGDPSSLSAAPPPASAVGRSPVDALPLGDLATSCTIGLEADHENATIVRGETVALVAAASAPIRLVDRAEAVDRLQRWLIQLARGTTRASSWSRHSPITQSSDCARTYRDSSPRVMTSRACRRVSSWSGRRHTIAARRSGNGVCGSEPHGHGGAHAPARRPLGSSTGDADSRRLDGLPSQRTAGRRVC